MSEIEKRGPAWRPGIGTPPKVSVGIRHRAPAVILSAGDAEAVFLPAVGMLGASLRFKGEEFLALPGGISGFRAGHTTGLPVLAPWANRLGSRRYRAGSVTVDLHGLDLHTDGNGLPIHGTMVGEREWNVTKAEAGTESCTLEARFDHNPSAPLFGAFPFPHEITLAATVRPDGVAVETRIRPTSELAVPICFGFHPYLRLPRGDRCVWRLRFPRCRHLELDPLGLPTGKSKTMPQEDEPLGQRTFDDAYELTGQDRHFALSARGRRLVVDFEKNYSYAQVYAPPGARFVCIEPMTAPANSLIDGRYQAVPPGKTFSARFSVRMQVHNGSPPYRR